MQNLLNILTRIGPGRVFAIGLTIAGLLGFLGYFVDHMAKPEMAVLFSDLEPADAGSVVNHLETMGVRVEVGAGGSAVMAPKGDIARLRMLLAQDGLPAGGGMGYELLDKSDGLGATSFSQQMTRLRALEGELARSIRTLGPVKQARVHLVLPKRELFSREQQEPSASIVVAVKGASLSAGQVAAIRHLVAAAVPKLQADNVSIVDTAGNLLASGESIDPTGEKGVSNGVQGRKMEIEQRLAGAIERLLERAVGAGSVRAEVSAELDFDRVTTNSEKFDPEGQVLRSSQLVTEESLSNEGGKNNRVSVDRNLPNGDEGGGAEGGNGPGSQSARTEEISNFEISKTVRTHIRESGLVRRLSVAVMVDAEPRTDAEGKTTYHVRTPEQLATLEAIAKSAVGFDSERGDRFEIASLEFVRPEMIFGDENPDAIVLTKEDYFRMGQIAALFVIALLAVLLVMRPAVTRAFGGGGRDEGASAGAAGTAQLPGPDGQPVAALAAPDAAGEEGADRMLEPPAGIDLDAIQGGINTANLSKIGGLIDEYPEEAVAVLRGWMQGE